jgi:hypothetical protein
MHACMPLLLVLMLLLTMMQLVIRLKRVLMLGPSQICIMHRPMLLIVGLLQLHPLHSTVRDGLL